jgi:hypothetical protein
MTANSGHADLRSWPGAGLRCSTGEISRLAAERQVIQPQAGAPGLAGKARCIYADPPWSFNVRSAKGKGRSAEAHYDVMDVEDIARMPVSSWAADDCVLLLWVTDPNLPRAFEVIEAWGFEYKTVGFSWVKTTRVESRTYRRRSTDRCHSRQGRRAHRPAPGCSGVMPSASRSAVDPRPAHGDVAHPDPVTAQTSTTPRPSRSERRGTRDPRHRRQLRPPWPAAWLDRDRHGRGLERDRQGPDDLSNNRSAFQRRNALGQRKPCQARDGGEGERLQRWLGFSRDREFRPDRSWTLVEFTNFARRAATA